MNDQVFERINDGKVLQNDEVQAHYQEIQNQLK